jgi:hypothetical protein
MLSVIMLSVIMMSVIMLNVVMLSVAAQFHQVYEHEQPYYFMYVCQLNHDT